ncbi:MAG: hypothetical protein D4R64_06225 [Porphyromonadaceae bacterium]|nr:MAG: hypothetical protein D4R64_06225 [Porphyromonadaceae bacterium]
MPKLKTTVNAGIRYDNDNGAIRSYFNPEFVEVPVGGDFSNSAVTDEFLASNADLFNFEGIDLILAEEKEGSSQTTCKYEQYHKNIPVYGAYINVTLRKTDRQVMSSVNKIDYDIPVDIGQALVRISSEDALKLMHEKYDQVCHGITHSEPKLFIYHQYLVWRIEMDTLDPKGYWELLINAVEGSFMEVFDRRRYYASRPAKIFWPDPVTSSQNPALHWGSPESVLDEELVDATLENLDDPAGSTWYLSGKWVRIAEIEDPSLALPATGSHFNYTSKDRKLLSVMAYYYIDRLVEWLRSLEIPAFNDGMTGPIAVDAQALDKADNSHFVVPVSGSAYLGFGEGGTPDASDPGVIAHEFGHALHYFLLGRLLPPASSEEGFNDFLSCVFRDRFNVHRFDRANPFPWDNNSTVNWDPTRRCDMEFRFDDPSYDNYGFYKKGTVYAAALWDIYLEIGGKSENADDRLKAAGNITGTCLDMLIAVGDTGPVMDLANGLISSDNSRTGGRYEKVIRDAFRKRGLWS